MQFQPVMDTFMLISTVSVFFVCMCKCKQNLFFCCWDKKWSHLQNSTLYCGKKEPTQISKRLMEKCFTSLMMNKLFHHHIGEPDFHWHLTDMFSGDVKVWVSKLRCCSTHSVCVCVCVCVCSLACVTVCVTATVSDKTNPTRNSPQTLQP